jgi:hypothetical protein
MRSLDDPNVVRVTTSCLICHRSVPGTNPPCDCQIEVNGKSTTMLIQVVVCDERQSTAPSKARVN